ncbi:DNA cytosine methyltransferase [Clostridioides difficile]|nr:DNA cytosine methyltransferase [Clostridioides difficile]
MNVLSLFDGMSCGQIALKKIGLKVENYFASEIKEHAKKVTQYNYPNTIQLGNIRDISFENGVLKSEDGLYKVSCIDLLMGGSPCQDLSRGNKNIAGLEGQKSGLFYEYLRLLKEINPKYFLLENVKMKKEYENKISGYLGVKPILIDSKLVSAGLRKRLYWTNIPNVTQPRDKEIKLQDILEHGYTDRDKARCLLESDSRPLITPIKMFHRYFSTGFTTLIFKNKEHYEKCKKHYNENFKGFSAKEIFYDGNAYDGVRYLTKAEREKNPDTPKRVL